MSSYRGREAIQGGHPHGAAQEHSRGKRERKGREGRVRREKEKDGRKREGWGERRRDRERESVIVETQFYYEVVLVPVSLCVMDFWESVIVVNTVNLWL